MTPSSVQLKLEHNKQEFFVDLNRATSLSIAQTFTAGVNLYSVAAPEKTPLTHGDFIGDMQQGSSCNADTISLTPHCHGTHTESAAHIGKGKYINQLYKNIICLAQVISIETLGNESPITAKDLAILNTHNIYNIDALVIRTLPNQLCKTSNVYDKQNIPPFFNKESIEFLNTFAFKHLLIDLPSLDHIYDKELAAHHTFWHTNIKKTITELIYVPNELPDNTYLLNLQLTNFNLDATPSSPVLYPLEKI